MLEKSIAHYFQSRNLSFIELNAKNFRSLSKIPTGNDISKYFDERRDQFKSPNKKTIKIGQIDFENLVKQQKIGNKLIKDYYDKNIGSFQNKKSGLLICCLFLMKVVKAKNVL